MPQLAFLLHPFSEPTYAGLQEGNTIGFHPSKISTHWRKLLVSDYTRHVNNEGFEVEGPATFYGEWEAPSLLLKRRTQRIKGLAGKYLHKPLAAQRAITTSDMTTDPMVFGSQFAYTHCQQNGRGLAYTLQKLEPGSIILFGKLSGSRRTAISQFFLDTLFVVDKAGVPNQEFNSIVSDLNLLPFKKLWFNQVSYLGTKYLAKKQETISYYSYVVGKHYNDEWEFYPYNQQDVIPAITSLFPKLDLEERSWSRKGAVFNLRAEELQYVWEEISNYLDKKGFLRLHHIDEPT